VTPRMRVTVVGCSGSLPGPLGPASCYLVEADDFRLVVDLGSGSLGPLQHHWAVGDIDAVLVTHLHPDHCMDLLPLYVARTYHPSVDSSVGMQVIPVHAPAGAATHLARAYGKAEPPGLTGRFDFVDWSPGPRRIGPFTVTAAQMVHPVPNWAVRIEHQGAVLAYSGDTGATDALVELARDADLALFESAFEEVRDVDAPKDVHLTGGEAGEHATRAGARRLVLTHLPPWNEPEVSLAAARSSYSGPVEVAFPGATYEL
jgi:ribonuclease BN (tRNA processing enzyme)